MLLAVAQRALFALRLEGLVEDFPEVLGSFEVLQILDLLHLLLACLYFLSLRIDLHERPRAESPEQCHSVLAVSEGVLGHDLLRVVNLHDAFKFHLERFLKSLLASSEKLLELSIELLLHSLQVTQRYSHQHGVLNRLDSELPDDVEVPVLEVLEHVFNINVLLARGDHKVDFSEIVAVVYFNINDIFPKGQDEASNPLSEEVDLSNKVCLVVNVLLGRDEHLPQQWTDPAEETLALLR